MLGRYRVERVLRSDAGGDASLLLAIDPVERVSRVLRPLRGDDAKVRAAIGMLIPLCGIRDPHLAALLSVERDLDTGTWYTVSEWVEGTPFATRRGSLGRNDRIAIVCDVLRGLATLHALSLAHGDVSASNVIVTPRGRGVLIDPAFADPSGAARGTLHYLAPERVLSAAPTPAADVYACGALLFESLADEPLVDATDATECVRAILAGFAPDALESRLADRATAEVIGRLLERDPALRIRDAELARTAIRAATGLEHTTTESAVAVAVDAIPIAEPTRVAIERRLAAIANARGGGVLVIEADRDADRCAMHSLVRSLARTRGLLVADIATWEDPKAALTELAHAARPVVALLDTPRESEPVPVAVAEVARALDHGILHGALVFCGDLDAARLALPHDVALAVDRLAPAPLTVADVERYLRRAVPRLEAPAGLAAEIHRRAAGDGAATRELLQRFAARDGIVATDGGVIADLTRLEQVTLATDESSEPRALDRIAEPERRILAVFAAATTAVPIALLEEVLPGAGPQLLAALTRAARAGLLRGFAPPHSSGVVVRTLVPALTRDAEPATRAAAARLGLALARRRGSLESRLAAAELMRFGGRRAAGRVARAVARDALSPAHAAASIALSALAIEAACDLPRGALPTHQWMRGRASFLAGDVVAAEVAFAAHAEATRSRSDGGAVDAIIEYAQLLDRRSRASDGLAVIDAAMGRVGGAGSIRLRAVRAWLLEAIGNTAEARGEIRRLFAARGEIEDDAAMLDVAAVASASFDRSGERRLARQAAVVARRVAARLRRIGRTAHFDSTLAIFDLEAGRVARARRRLERAVSRLESIGDRRLLPDALTRLGFARLETGDAKLAFATFQRAAVLFARAGDGRGLGWARSGEGVARLSIGDPEGARACFESSLELRTAARSRVGAALAAAELLRAHGWLGDSERLRPSIREALARSCGPDLAAARLTVLLVIAELARDRGDRAVYRGCARRAALLAERIGAVGERATAESFVAELEAIAGDERGALRRLRLARRLAREAGRRAALCEANAIRAATLASLKRSRPARRVFARAAAMAPDAASRAAAGIAFARGIRRAFGRGAVDSLRAGRDAARDAQHAALAASHRPRIAAARELVAALDAALEGPLVHRDLERENRQLRQVLEASRWINEAESVAELLSRILDAALELTGASRGFVVTGQRGAVRFESARNLRQEDIERPEMMLSRSLVDRVLDEGITIVTSEARADERFREYRSIARLELLSVLCAPMRVRRGVIGAIYVDDPDRVDRFDEAARSVVEALAEQAASVLDKARLRDEVAELNQRLRADVVDRTNELAATRRDLARARADLAARSVRLVSQDARMLEIQQIVERVADADAPVLVLGEPGTGKELVARELHDRSFRRRRNFVAVHCAALPDTLIEAELFGYRRGAFTGATRDKDGVIVAADQGTLFLDEIADLQPAAQAKLLRVLQDGEIVPLGATRPVRVAFRLVAATNRPLKRWVEEGRFREDLYWRLRVLQLELPPLRERAGDVPLLVAYFAQRQASSTGHRPRAFSDQALAALAAAPFHGNVRELQSVVHSLLLTAPHDPIGVEDLPPEYRRVGSGAPCVSVRGDGEGIEEDLPLKDAVAAFERARIAAALAATSGNRVQAAKRLGIARRWLQTLIERYGL